MRTVPPQLSAREGYEIRERPVSNVALKVVGKENSMDRNKALDAALS